MDTVVKRPFFGLILKAIVLILFLLPGQLSAQILLEEGFTGNTAPGWILGNDASLTGGNGDPIGDGWLQLTTATNIQTGYAYLVNSFPSTQGLILEFDFTIWGGSGADGFTVFLFDGANTNFQVGGFGGSLGYAPICGQVGLSDAYVGIAFDEFGNFSNPTECRNGGTQFTPDAVAIRGPGNDSTGYEYLTGTPTLPTSLDIITGSRPDQSGVDYRRARVEITPNGVSYTINVAIQYGRNNPYTQIINDYPLPSVPPPTLKLGFAASTGALNNFHEIRQVAVTVPTDLSLEKTVDNPAPIFGDILRYTLKAWNNGPNDATNTVVYDVLPPGLRFVTALMSQGTFSVNQDTVFGDFGTVVEGDTATMTLLVKAEGSGPFENIAYVSSDQNDLNPFDNGDTLAVNVSPSFPIGPTFNCDATFYVSGQDGTIDLHELGRSTTPFDISRVNLNSGVNIDAIGIRRQDGYIYGSNNGNLLRIDSDGAATDLGRIYQLPNVTYNAAAVDIDGYLWVYRESNSKFYRIDVDFTSSTYREVVDSLSSNAGNLEDFVFHPYQQNSVYAYSGSDVKQVNMLSGLTTSIASNQARGDLEAMFIDPAGNLFGYEDGTGVLWKFDLTTGDGVNLGSVNNSVSDPIDGCNCPYGPYMEKYVLPATAEPGDTVTYYFAMSNANTGAISGLTFSDILPGGFTYVAGTLQNPFGGSANAYAGTSALTITGLSLPAATQGLISIDVAIPDNENLVNNTFFNQASLLNVPSSFGGPQLDSDNPNTGELGDPTPIGIVAPSQGVRGRIFEDVNYGGGDGRDYDAANTSAVNSGFAADLISVEGVRLELYDAAGNFVDADTSLADGSYAFPFLADGSYSVRAVNATVRSQRPANSTGVPTFAVQTYRVNGSSGQVQDVINEIGGASPNLQDDPPNLTSQPLSAISAQSVAPVTLNGEYVEDIDFGFNFNTIVNVNDSGQGSLRQFILNSNELANTNLDQEDAPSGVASVSKPAGIEHSIFMIPASNLVVTNDGGSGTAMNIQPASSLGSVTDNNTAIVGETQTAFSGDTNTGVSELSNGPEVVLDYRESVDGAGISFLGDGFILSGIGIGRVDGSGITGVGIQITGSGGIVRNSTIYANGNTGLKMDNTADNNIESNVIRSNAVDNSAADGIQLSNVSNTTILSNEIVDNGGYGIDFVIGNNNTITVQGNLIKGNGNSPNTEDGGIGLRNGQDNIVSQNTITENSGDGIVVRNNQFGNLISQNSMFANGELGIDLDAGSGNQGDDVSLNDLDDTDNGGNTLLNFPILEAADLNSANNTITITGFARPGSIIELFLAAPDASGFGEGQVYLLTLTEGSADDRDATTATYGPGAVNGLLQGTDNTERFDFQITVPPGVSNGSYLTSTARDGSGNTSEFSGIVQVSESGIELSGVVYSDPNHNATLDGDESGSGLTLFAKLLDSATPGGPATSVVPVDPATGAYLFTRVNPGVWTIIISANGNPADVQPVDLPEWVGTEAPLHVRANIQVTTSSLENLNFGLYNGSVLRGLVFEDNGLGGGIANNGIQDGAEVGIPKVRIYAEDAGGGTIYDNASTAAEGTFTLWMSASLISTPIQIREANLSGYLSTGGNSGTTGGTYDAFTDLVTFAFQPGQTYEGIEYADVREHSLTPDNASHTAPGTVVFYSHIFDATTAASVEFSLAGVATPVEPAYGMVLYRDLDCDGNLDSNDVAISAPLVVSAGDQICLITKVQVPPNAPNGGQHVLTLSAAVDYTNAAPTINRLYSVTDVTTIGDGNSGLVLEKSSPTASAAPGDTITYAITYTNFGTEPIGDLVIKDVTPSYTTLADATADALPDNLTSVTIAAPATGKTGAIRWEFTGQLLPGASGVVRFRVVLD